MFLRKPLFYSLILISFTILFSACTQTDQKSSLSSSKENPNWQKFDLPGFHSTYSLAFPEKGTGFASGERGKFYTFINNAWTVSAIPSKEQIFSIAFTSDKKGMAVGSAARFSSMKTRLGQKPPLIPGWISWIFF